MIQISKRIVANLFRASKGRLYSMKISEILETKKVDINTTVQGWVKLIRKMKKFTFIDINDGSTFKLLQIVIPSNVVPDDLSNGCSVKASGILKMQKNGQMELHPESIELIGNCHTAEGYPFIPKKKYDQDELREFLHFRPRSTSIFATALRVRNDVTFNVHDYFRREGYINIHTPILTSNDCEGAGETFHVMLEDKTLVEEMKKENKTDEEAYFDRKVFLTVSGQLHLESAARALSNVYQFGPVFRAENSKSRLHLTEFYMVEAEIAFLNNIEELLRNIEKLIKTVTQNVLDSCEEEILHYRDSIKMPNHDILKHIIDTPYRILEYDEATSILKANSDQLKQPLSDHRHLSKEHELFLVKHCAAPVFIIKWPKDKKPFYVKNSQDESHVDAVDLLFPEVGEICGGSLREDKYDVLKEKLISNDLAEKLDWYLELRKYGNVPTGGYGMGFERYLKVLLGTPNVKDTIPFPRWSHNCKM